MKHFLFIASTLTLLSLLGCDRRNENNRTVRTTTLAVTSTPTTTTDERTEYRTSANHFLSEVKVGIKLLTTSPSLFDVQAKQSHVKDLFARLPTRPAGVHPDVTDLLSELVSQFDRAETFIKIGLPPDKIVEDGNRLISKIERLIDR